MPAWLARGVPALVLGGALTAAAQTPPGHDATRNHHQIVHVQ
jgi:hypothetical protein